MFKGRIDFDKTPENIIKYIDTLGGNIEFYYWNVADNFEIEVPIKTKNIKD